MVAQYFEQKTKELRAKRIAEGKAEWRDWSDRKKAAEARGEPFNEPEPGSEEALRRERGALERSFMYRLRRRRIWPHLLATGVICTVIACIALGFGVVWLLSYLAGLIGGLTLFLIIVVPPVLFFTYRGLVGFFKYIYRTDDCRDGADDR